MITLIKGCRVRKKNGLEVGLYPGVQPTDLPADWVAQIPVDCFAPPPEGPLPVIELAPEVGAAGQDEEE